MTDNPHDDELTEAEEAHLAAFLSDPGLWEEPSMEDEDAIVAAISSEAALFPQPERADVRELPANVIPISRARRWLAPVAAGIAAALVVLAGFAFVSAGDDDPEGVVLALEGTDIAPDATAEAVVAPLPAGTRIVLDVSGLPPAEPGTYYEAWMRVDAEIGVSAGTFHLRGGDATIELWSGVTPTEYPLITVTLQSEAQPESSGAVVLAGLLNPTEFAG